MRGKDHERVGRPHRAAVTCSFPADCMVYRNSRFRLAAVSLAIISSNIRDGGVCLAAISRINRIDSNVYDLLISFPLAWEGTRLPFADAELHLGAGNAEFRNGRQLPHNSRTIFGGRSDFQERAWPDKREPRH